MDNVERHRKIVQLKTDPSFASKIQTTHHDERLITDVSRLNSNSATDLNMTDAKKALSPAAIPNPLPIISEAANSIETAPLNNDSSGRPGLMGSEILQYSNDNEPQYEDFNGFKCLRPRPVEKDTIQSDTPYQSTNKHRHRREATI